MVKKMLKIKCIKKCFYKGKIFSPGKETSISSDGIFPEKCFNYKGKIPSKIKLPSASGSVTLLGDGPSLKYADLINTPVAAVNCAGVKHLGKLDYWISLHPEFFALWRNRRRKAGRNVNDVQFISHRVPINPEVIRSPDYLSSGGGSGLYALETLVKMGFNHVHLIGIDLTDEYEVFRGSWKPGNFNIKITSHSGFLKELFS